jgi:hypothetical protein
MWSIRATTTAIIREVTGIAIKWDVTNSSGAGFVLTHDALGPDDVYAVESFEFP